MCIEWGQVALILISASGQNVTLCESLLKLLSVKSAGKQRASGISERLMWTEELSHGETVPCLKSKARVVGDTPDRGKFGWNRIISSYPRNEPERWDFWVNPRKRTT